MPSAISLSQYHRRLSDAIAQAGSALQNVWIVAETSDVRVSGGHCYMELVEKDANNGRIVAKSRATIWSYKFVELSARFFEATGQRLASDMKVMVQVSVNFHTIFGLSLNITDINPAFTMGDLIQRRNEMIRTLKEEGILEDNRNLPLVTVPQRIAVISAPGAAGYGDFVKQLLHNSAHLKFFVKLFPAIMQGDRTAVSIVAALDAINEEAENWDCVVIIRGGGATTDLAAFENLDLARNIACYPLPVITGIGHDRDITLLSYVAHVDLKTPTAVAEFLIGRGEEALQRLQALAGAIHRTAAARLSGCKQQLAFAAGQLPSLAKAAIIRASRRLDNCRMAIAGIADRRLRPLAERLDAYARNISQGVAFAIARAKQRLDADGKLLEVLSPQATLRRGYSITLGPDGHAITSARNAEPGTEITTVLPDGTIKSTVV